MTKSYVHDPLVDSLPKTLFITRSTLEIGESIGQGIKKFRYNSLGLIMCYVTLYM